MTRSLGTLPPVSAAMVGNRSIACTISLLTEPGSILPGQRIAKGTRRAPSKPVNKVPRHGPAVPPDGTSTVMAD